MTVAESPGTGPGWVPSACTLPTTEQPLRAAEFDEVFATDVLAVHAGPDEVRLELRPDAGVAARVAGLAVRETSCCSFFTFDLHAADGRVELTIRTGPAHREVLSALADRAVSRSR
ncbi:hypothetical protein GIS00_17615 [Nakamurella sp. YIM 132087]|uniref:Arsenate reductase n=1 Tax=Nakamurella alba TaxID=2665158 RepID=A0A7K1FNL5_9ACTN|nr:hypothetical protein [Nakamurella alba]MTD15755.1 hypothetical protein [Nakamurella alba]